MVQKRYGLAILLWLTLWLPVHAVAMFPEEGEEPLPPGVSRECIEEPVFAEVACIYEANREAERTIVLVHGLNGRALRDWGKQIPLLARDYHVLTFDLPGFGSSDREVAYYAPTTYARFIHFVTERYAKGPFVLVGHSMGGAIALRYTARYPAEVERLVLVDVAGVLQRMAYARELAKGWVETNATDDRRVTSFLDKITNKLLSKVEVVSGPANELLARQVLRNELLDVDSSVIAALTLVNEDLSDALEAIHQPTLLLWGGEDRVAPRRTADLLLALLDNAHLELIDGAAHVPMVEQPERFNQLFLDYLQLEQPDFRVESTARHAPQPGAIGGRDVECMSQSDTVYEGHFDTLEIMNCNRVTIRNAVISRLVVRSSKVTIDNSTIEGNGSALDVAGSDVMITASRLRGEVAIHTSQSRIDLAAVSLEGSRASVQGEASSSLVFSVSTIDSPEGRQGVHGFYKVDYHQPL